MASPFKVFRKRRKELIVVLTLLAMFAFVVLPIVLQSMRTGPSTNTVVVKTSRFGNIDEAELHNMVNAQRTLRGFANQIGQRVAMAQSNPYLGQILARQYENLFGPAEEKSVVETWLLARRAQDLGLVVSDQAVNEFLRSITTAKGITAQVFRGMADANGITPDQVLDILASMKLSQTAVRPVERTIVGGNWRRCYFPVWGRRLPTSMGYAAAERMVTASHAGARVPNRGQGARSGRGS
jgi:hypothetical protein